MLYRELEPSPALRPYVRCFWILRTPEASVAPASLQRVLPDGCMDILFARSGPEREGRDAFSLTAVGAMTRYLEAIPLPLRLGVRFEPGRGPLFLRAPAATLTDVEVPLGELWGADGRRLLADMADTPSDAGRPREEVAGTFARVVSAGATSVQQPHEQPWGQVVSYVRDPDGHLVEICSPVG